MSVYKKAISGFAFISILVFLTGCIYTTTRAKLNMDYANRRYSNLVIICSNEDSEKASATEENVQQYFINRKLDWIHCFPFSSEYYEESENEKASFKTKLSAFIKKNKIDGIIFVSDSGMNFSTYVTGMTRYNRYYTGVNTETEKSISLKMELFDAKSRRSVWYSKGGASSSSILRTQQDLMNFFTNDSLDKLSETGLLDGE